jgi:hypothetical protein
MKTISLELFAAAAALLLVVPSLADDQIIELLCPA